MQKEINLIDENNTDGSDVTICMLQEDIDGMKAKAAEAGIPYQTLINSIIHRYLNGGIILKNAI